MRPFFICPFLYLSLSLNPLRSLLDRCKIKFLITKGIEEKREPIKNYKSYSVNRCSAEPQVHLQWQRPTALCRKPINRIPCFNLSSKPSTPYLSSALRIQTPINPFLSDSLRRALSWREAPDTEHTLSCEKQS